MAVMAREAWTDERLDDLKDHMDEGFCGVKGEIRSLRSEVKGEMQLLRSEVKGEVRALRTELKGEIATTRLELKGEIGEVRGGLEKLSERFDRLNVTLIAALIGLLAMHYLG